MFPTNRPPGYFDNVRSPESLRKVPSFDPEPKSVPYPYFEQYPVYAPRIDFTQPYLNTIDYDPGDDFPMLNSRPPGFANEDFYPPPGFSKPLKTKAPNPNAVSFIPSHLAPKEDFVQKHEEEDPEIKEYGVRGALPLQKSLPEDKKTLALGKDLSSSTRKLHENYSSYLNSAFTDQDIEPNELPEFTIPLTHIISKPIFRSKQFKQFTEMTLFYIFYNMPGESAQSFAADHLYQRNWVYDPNKQVWYASSGSDWKTFDVNKFEIVSTQAQAGPFLMKEEVPVKQR